jgi:carbamoyltransferase
MKKPQWILGWHGGILHPAEIAAYAVYEHDSSAALLCDGRIFAAIEEERLSRVKHYDCFPALAIRHCLATAGIRLQDVDIIVRDVSLKSTESFLEKVYIANSAAKKLSAIEWTDLIFQREFGVSVAEKIRFCSHHRAHLWNAFYPSGFRRSLVISLDGVGEDASGVVATADGKALTILKTFPFEQSLGEFYRSSIGLLGYKIFDEYKVMGLAPYGNPETFRAFFEGLYRLLPDGEFAFIPAYQRIAKARAAGLLQKTRRKWEPFEQWHKDLAAGVQETLEKIALHMIGYYQRKTGEKNLCLSGGVAHNCTMNGKLLGSGWFNQIFVQPAAHDGGNALGAAGCALIESGHAFPRRRMEHVLFGTPITGNGILRKQLQSWNDLLTFSKSSSVEKKGADLLAQGAVIGWAQGRSEFGPRALGNRSILADPRPVGNRERINSMVKKREGYRPFAPSVLEEKMRDYFDVSPDCHALPFMVFVVNVRPDKRELLGAVTHVDGSARVQTVARQSNPRYWRLIREFEKRTGIPVVLNTSFNNNFEPIVDSVDDAVVCFLTTGLDYLIIGDYIISRKSPEIPLSSLLRMTVKLSSMQRLVKGIRENDRDRPSCFFLDSIANVSFRYKATEISAETFSILFWGDGNKTLEELFEQTQTSLEARARALPELMDLWHRRMVVFNPRSATPKRAKRLKFRST